MTNMQTTDQSRVFRPGVLPGMFRPSVTGIRRFLLGVLTILTAVLYPAVLVNAQAGSGVYLDDQADLFSSDEEEMLSDELESLTRQWNQDFVVVTTRDAEGKDSQDYADDYYDTHGYQENGVLYLIDLDNGNVWISTSGYMIRVLTDSRIDSVIDAGYDELHRQAYANGVFHMLEMTEVFLEAGVPDHQYTYDVETGKVVRHYALSPLEVIVAVTAALGCGGIFFGAVCAKYRMKHEPYEYPYLEKSDVHMTRKEDVLVNQFVTSRQIPKNPPPSSGGGGGRSSVHTSSGGHTHGGGGRSL